MRSGHGLQVSQTVSFASLACPWSDGSVKAVFCLFCCVRTPDGKAGRYFILFHYVFRMFVFVLFLLLTKTCIKRSHNDFLTSFYRYSPKKQEQGIETHTFCFLQQGHHPVFSFILLAFVNSCSWQPTPSAPWQISVKHLYLGKSSFINVKLIKNMCVSDTYHYSEQKLIFFKSNEMSLSKKLLPLIIRHVKNYEK